MSKHPLLHLLHLLHLLLFLPLLLPKDQTLFNQEAPIIIIVIIVIIIIIITISSLALIVHDLRYQVCTLVSQRRRDYLSKYRIPPLPSTSLLELDSPLLFSLRRVFFSEQQHLQTEKANAQLDNCPSASTHKVFFIPLMISICEYIYVRVWKRKNQTQKKSGYVLLFVPKCAQPPNHPPQPPSIHHVPKMRVAQKMPILLLVSQLLLVFCGASFVSPSPSPSLAHTHTLTHTHAHTLTSTHTHTLSPNWEFAHTAFQ